MTSPEGPFTKAPTMDECWREAANSLIAARWETGHPEKANALTNIAAGWVVLGATIGES